MQYAPNTCINADKYILTVFLCLQYIWNIISAKLFLDLSILIPLSYSREHKKKVKWYLENTTLLTHHYEQPERRICSLTLTCLIV